MLALFEFFWDAWPAGEPPPASATATAVAAISSLGSKNGKEVDWAIDPSFEYRAPEDFWVVRENFLKRLKAEAEEVVPHERVLEVITRLDKGIPDVQAITETVAQRERAYRTAGLARTTVELNSEAAKILSLTDQLFEQLKRQDEEDILMLLLVV